MSIAEFSTIEKVVEFCRDYHHRDLAVMKEHDGRYRVYDLRDGTCLICQGKGWYTLGRCIQTDELVMADCNCTL